VQQALGLGRDKSWFNRVGFNRTLIQLVFGLMLMAMVAIFFA
jgi:hypothetical protein